MTTGPDGHLGLMFEVLCQGPGCVNLNASTLLNYNTSYISGDGVSVDSFGMSNMQGPSTVMSRSGVAFIGPNKAPWATTYAWVIAIIVGCGCFTLVFVIFDRRPQRTVLKRQRAFVKSNVQLRA